MLKKIHSLTFSFELPENAIVLKMAKIPQNKKMLNFVRMKRIV